MDSFAKKYLIGLIAVLVLAAGAWYLNRDTRVADINAMLAADSVLAGYPYPFRVRSLQNGVAIMGSPRTADVPVMQFLRTAFPELRETAVNDAAMMAAQDRLVEKQSRAAELVQGEDDVNAVRWELDERWYNEHGVFLNR